MSIKDRITNAKKAKQEIPQEKDFSEFNISILKLLDLIKTVESPEKLGLIVKEIAKFLENFATENMAVTISGDLDCGKQALLSCLLAGVIEERTEYLQRELNASMDSTIDEITPAESPETEEETLVDVEQQVQELPIESAQAAVEEQKPEDPPMVKKRKTLRQKLKGM